MKGIDIITNDLIKLINIKLKKKKMIMMKNLKIKMIIKK